MALVKLTVLALVTAPVDALIKSTIGIATNPVPVMFIVVAVSGAIVCDTSATVGFVSLIVAKDKTPDPFVINACPLDPVVVGTVNAKLPANADETSQRRTGSTHAAHWQGAERDGRHA